MEETPWAMVQRMRAEAAPFEQIVLALQKSGLAREDIELLLKGAPELLPPPLIAPLQVERVSEMDLSISTKPGAPLRWFGLAVAEGAAAVGAFAWQSEEPWGAGLTAVGAIGTVGLLVPELKTGVRRTLKKLSALHFLVGMMPALHVLMSGWHTWNTPFTVAFLTSVPLMIWASITGERLKGLKDFAKGAAVFEHNGVQFVLAAPESPMVAPGETVEVVVLAQNCVDADRKLLIEVMGDPQSVLAERAQAHSLLPGCVVRFTVPVRPQPLAPKVFTATIGLLGVGGAAGPRVRLAQGAEWVAPSTALRTNLVGAITFAAVGVGSFALGSNGSIRIKVDIEKPFVDVPRTTQVTTLYQPTGAELKAAAES
jgi:hypothetical protein